MPLTYMKIIISLSVPRDLEYGNVLNPRLVSLRFTYGKIRILLELGCKLETLDKENDNALFLYLRCLLHFKGDS